MSYVTGHKTMLIATIEFEYGEQNNPGKIGELVNKAVENYLDRLSYSYFQKIGTLCMEELKADGVHVAVMQGVRRLESDLPLPEPQYSLGAPRGSEEKIIKGRIRT